MIKFVYEIWNSEPDRKELGPFEKEFIDERQMRLWIAEQNEHPWLYIKEIKGHGRPHQGLPGTSGQVG